MSARDYPAHMVYACLPSPVGELLAVADGGALVELSFDAPRALARRRTTSAEVIWHAPGEFAAFANELRSYFAGELREFAVPLAPAGSAFEQRVWSILRTIPYGVTTSYGAIARELGVPNAARAVGTANGRNPIAIVIPCHRVIGADGGLTGYGGGLARKRLLLELEGRQVGLFAPTS